MWDLAEHRTHRLPTGQPAWPNDRPRGSSIGSHRVCRLDAEKRLCGDDCHAEQASNLAIGTRWGTPAPTASNIPHVPVSSVMLRTGLLFG